GKKYKTIQENEVLYEEYRTDDAEIILFGFGIVSRLLQTSVDELRLEGIKVGLFRPITLFPFPIKEIGALAARDNVKYFHVFEMNNGQMVDDIRLVNEGRKPVKFYGRCGGNVHSVKEIKEEIMKELGAL
ncbi:MAG: 3-methyl-2-oxobutanoate dehydrogenase subunit beta, partial [Candidatus Marinimicrobia bacterium]|nr:3-methyl-2-oxobutanoate dehydrogenase subunit beta [Candidatus Neomarinimicrobiota bacterium]